MGSIVISGRPGAGSSTLAKRLAESLKHSYFSPGTIFKSIGRGSIESLPFYNTFLEVVTEYELSLDFVPDKSLSDSEAARAVWGSELGRNPLFHEAIDETQRRLATSGNVVIDGKLSIRMLKGLSALSVWVDASEEDRVYRTMKRDSLNYELAKEIIIKRETLERDNWKSIYGFDYFDQKNDASLVVDSSKQSLDELVSSIIIAYKALYLAS